MRASKTCSTGPHSECTRSQNPNSDTAKFTHLLLYRNHTVFHSRKSGWVVFRRNLGPPCSFHSEQRLEIFPLKGELKKFILMKQILFRRLPTRDHSWSLKQEVVQVHSPDTFAAIPSHTHTLDHRCCQENFISTQIIKTAI